MTRVRRSEQILSPITEGPGSKRQKKAHDLLTFKITDQKTPEHFAHSSGGRSAPVATGSSSSSRRVPENVTPATAMEISKPVSVASKVAVPLPEGVLETGRHSHHGFRWLYKERRDKTRRRPDDPDYNPRTLYVPESFLKGETPAMQQWWSFKSENMDTVLFFKVCRRRTFYSSLNIFFGTCALL